MVFCGHLSLVSGRRSSEESGNAMLDETLEVLSHPDVRGVRTLVFEREAREFQSFYTAMFQLRHLLLTHTTRKSLEKMNA